MTTVEKIKAQKKLLEDKIYHEYDRSRKVETIDKLSLKYGKSVATIYNIIRRHK